MGEKHKTRTLDSPWVLYRTKTWRNRGFLKSRKRWRNLVARNLGSSSVHEKSKISEIVDFENSGKWGF